MHASGGRRVQRMRGAPVGRPSVGRYVRVLGLLCVTVTCLVGYAREIAHSPGDWPVAVIIGVLAAIGSAAAWRRFDRMPKRREIKSRLVNVLAGVLFLALFIFLMAVLWQALGSMMAQVVPVSWLSDGGIPFHPTKPGFLFDAFMVYVLTLLVMLTMMQAFPSRLRSTPFSRR